MRLLSGPDRWSTLLGTALLVGLCAASIARAALPAPTAATAQVLGPGHLHVSDVEAAGLLRAVADAVQVNLVAAVPIDERKLSLDLRFASADELLFKLAAALDLQLTMQGRVAVMHPGCERGAARTAALGLPETVSLNFQTLALQTLFELFELKPVVQGADTGTLMRSLFLVRAKELPQEEVVQALSLALGFDAVRDARGGMALSPAGGDACRRARLAALPVPPLSAASRLPLPPHGYCPYRAPATEENARVCQPLELFPLGSLTMRGHTEWAGRWSALIESPDGLLHSVAVRHYMGRDFGRVQSIGAEGLVLSEIIQDDKEEWVEVHTPVKRGVKTRLPPERLGVSYIEAGSPQHLYNQAVNHLFAFGESVAATPELCRVQFPQTAHALQQATAQWRVRNAALLGMVERHAQAYAERLAQDFELPPSRVMAHERDRHAKARARALQELGPPGGDAMKAHCERQPSALLGPASDLAVRFPSELQRLHTCREDRTCFNLRQP